MSPTPPLETQTKYSSTQQIFFPQYKQHRFHRLNLEYMAVLQNMDWQKVHTLLENGLRQNFQHQHADADDILHSIRPQLEHQSWHIAAQGRLLNKERQQLHHELRAQEQQSFLVYRADMEVEFARKKLSESLFTEGSHAFQQTLLAERNLKDALKVAADNYRAHFELGWLYRSLLVRLDNAEFHFSRAASLSQHSNPLFSRFALRHLADVRYGLKRYPEALEASLKGMQINAEHDPIDPEQHYELCRYLAAANRTEQASQQLLQLTTRNPEYYVQAQLEPDFAEQNIQQMLHDLQRKQITHIQHKVRKTWHDHPLAQIKLPDNLDPERFFQQVFQQHTRVMEKQPFNTLAQREQEIGDLVLESSRRNIQRELTRRSRQEENKVELQRNRWGWINQIGAMFIHSASILLVAAIMFVVLRTLASLFGMTGLLSSDVYLNYAVILLSIFLALGALLVQFMPFGTRKRLHKQVELDDAIPLLQNLH